MKKITLSVLVLSLAFAVQAQDEKQPRHPGKRGIQHGKIMEKLNLSEEQKAKFKSENEAFHKQMMELKKNEDITVREWKSKAETIRKDHKARIEGMFTPEQKDQLAKMKAERKDMAKVREKASAERMKIKLGLSDDQAAQMKKNRLEMSEKLKALREDKKLDETRKKEQMKELMKEHKEKTKSLLSEEQLKKLEDGRRKLHNKRPHVRKAEFI